jgi:amidase
MLDDIGEIAGMEGMAIVHGVCVNPQGSIVHMNNTEKHDPASCAIADLNADLEAKRVSSAELVAFYLDRITRIDCSGPALNSVIAVNPGARADATERDAERQNGLVRGPLHGIPILIKDNIETADPVPTTAGSLALKDNVTRRDAPCVARLRAAGAVILGKANLSEWANIRSNRSVSGWSAVGGLVRNPHVLDRSCSGSSSGSASAVAAGLAAAAVGTETDGSIVSPSDVCGIVGLKPTVGLVSRTHVVPIAASQDTPGPMTRCVADAALLLAAMAGRDPADRATAAADGRRAEYGAALSKGALNGARLGVWRPRRAAPATLGRFDDALDALREGGADLVMFPDFRRPKKIGALEMQVLLTELKAGLDFYLTTTPLSVKTRTLADIIAFNRGEPRELALFGQELFEAAALTHGSKDLGYRAALRNSRRMARRRLDAALIGHKLDAIVTVTGAPSWRVDLVRGDDNSSGESTTLPAVAGYPHLTVPMGDVKGLPLGLSFIGPAWSDARLLSLGYAFEQATKARLAPKFLPSLEDDAARDFARLSARD